MTRPFARFVGIDLGGVRGKTTAVAELGLAENGVAVRFASTRNPAGEVWNDTALWQYCEQLPDDAVVAVNAPLTAPACVRCPRPVCPGVELCDEPAVEWLRGPGQEQGAGPIPTGRLRYPPYLHRVTEVQQVHNRGMSLMTMTAASSSQVAARAGQLRRRLASAGILLDERLLEVSPVAALAVWFGHRQARSYKHDADPWPTRASVITALSDVGFAPTSGFARDEVVRNVHIFDAVIAAYTAYRWSVDNWQKPADACADDGFIWAPEGPIPSAAS